MMTTGRRNMSSTNKYDNGDFLEALCQELIDEISGGVREENLIPLSPNSELDSYYQLRTKTVITKSDFELNYSSVEELQKILEEQWSDYNKLQQFSRKIAKTAFELEKEVTLDEELPAFVYTL